MFNYVKNYFGKYLNDELSYLPQETIKVMLQEIGNVDPYLRDTLIYNSFTKLIFSNQWNSKKSEKLLLELLNDMFLFYKIGETDTDSVFTRSFSVLIIANIIANDYDKRELSDNLIHRTAELVNNYMRQEKDCRGYVEEKGWAHAIAHGADALAVLAKHPSITNTELDEILKSIELVLLKPTNFLDEEEERLARVIDYIIRFKDFESGLINWVINFADRADRNAIENPNSIEAYHSFRDVKNFLKSVYLF